MDGKINIKKLGVTLIIAYLIIGIAFYFIGGEQLQIAKSDDSISYESAEAPIGQILNNTKIEQDFSVNANIINSISIKTATYARKNTGNLLISLVDKNNGEILFNQNIDVSTLPDNDNFILNMKDNIKGVKGKTLALIITSDTDSVDNAVTLWSGKASSSLPLYINGQLSQNTLVFSVNCLKELWFGKYYWYMFTIGFLLLVSYLVNLEIKQKNSRKSIGINVLTAFVKYRFLLSQLVERDFKTKYKRSVLGVLWSFLNPLLTMLVQYIIFSTLFKSDIPNFPVYLLTGIVIFNFFSEACGMGLMSIVGNASLITKVYVPKYIYPVSRVFSSVINLLLSLIPLIIVMLITRTSINFSILLIPFGLGCTLLFSIGVTFILSSAMVFFRDTQFLWNVINLLWMYATPLFYPESIIPSKFSFILKINPMYHFIRFIRIIILQGVSPEPMAYLYCIIFSLGTLLIGALMFKKTQDKFVLNL
jgi:ABC-2 type transport system permease protein